MAIRQLTSAEDLRRYTAWVQAHPQGSLWQSLDWQTYQERLGRVTRIYVAEENSQIVASALVIIDRTAFGLSTWEIPRGPLFRGQRTEDRGQFMEKITNDARADHCLSVYLSPLEPLSTVHCSLSSRHIHPEATRILDLTQSDEKLLNQMKPKGRYNIRLAEKHGVTVTLSSNIDAYCSLARSTALRDGFRPPQGRTYQRFLESLPTSFLLLAFAPPTSPSQPSLPSSPSLPSLKPIAGLLGVIWGSTGLPTEAGAAAPAKVGIYYYGASGNDHRELMAPYLLQWKAMQHCRAQGCTSYDLFGIAPEGSVNHPWSSVSDFKAKFGGQVVTYPPEQEIVLRPMAKTVLRWKRALLG